MHFLHDEYIGILTAFENIKKSRLHNPDRKIHLRNLDVKCNLELPNNDCRELKEIAYKMNVNWWQFYTIFY